MERKSVHETGAWLGAGDKPEGSKFELFGVFSFIRKMTPFGRDTQKLPTFFPPQKFTHQLAVTPQFCCGTSC